MPMPLDFDSAELPNQKLVPEHHEWCTVATLFDREGLAQEYGGITKGINRWHSVIVNEKMAPVALGALKILCVIWPLASWDYNYDFY